MTEQTQTAPFTSWLWPDHRIGIRESRRLRKEHNALVNSHAELESLLAFYLGEGNPDTLHPVEAEYRKLASIEDSERTEEQTAKLVQLARRMTYVSSRNIFEWADQVERLEAILDKDTT